MEMKILIATKTLTKIETFEWISTRVSLLEVWVYTSVTI